MTHVYAHRLQRTGDPSLDPDDVLAAPRAEVVTDVGASELSALQSAADTAVPGLAWDSDGTGTEDSLLNMTIGGNGYGGRSLHRIYNSPNLLSDVLPADADWAGGVRDISPCTRPPRV